MSEAPERIWMDPDIKFPECEKQYGCDVEYVRADRMKELESENKRLRLEVAHANDTADAAIERAKELEAKLAKAVETLRVIEDASRLYASDRETDIENVRYAHECTRRLCVATLAELTGGKDE